MLPPILSCFVWFQLLLILVWPVAAPAQGHGDEERDWGISPSTVLRRPPYTAPTPREIPGASVAGTAQLQAMLASKEPPLLVDVLSSDGHLSIPGALWISGAGRGSNFFDPLQAAYGDALAKITQGNKDRAMVFFCASVQCWLSYNAALRASVLGYTRVFWYRGGIESWRAAGNTLEPLGASR
jgi:PQQ-dependent catabolism-associated CXXCW motif protein